MAEYISIAEAARRANISKQAVYQRLNKDLNKYVKVIDGKKQLHTDCLEILLKHVDSSSQQDCSTSLNQIIDTLRSQLAVKDQQIEVKDQQIAKKDKQIESLQELLKASNALMAGNIQVLLNQSQTTEEPAASKKEEESSSPPTPPPQAPSPSSEPAAPSPAPSSPPPTPKPKQSFWQRFFG